MTAPHIEERRLEGEIGGRTAQIEETGDVVCHVYEPAPLPDGWVRIKTVRSAISPGTERTLMGKNAPNVYLHRTWNDELKLFEEGSPSLEYPIIVGYRAAGEVIESRASDTPVGLRVYGNWPHTELPSMPAEYARAQVLPPDLSWDDGVEFAQMGPICVNAVAFAGGEHRDGPIVVFGAGPVGLLTAQIVKAEGADPVYVVDRLASRLEIAESLGLEPIDAASVDAAVTLKRRHGADGIAVVFECTGASPALHEAIRTVRPQGLVVVASFYQGDAKGLRLGEEFHHNGIRVVCGQIGNIHKDWTWHTLRDRSIELCASGQVRFGELPRLLVPIDEVSEGVEAMSRPEDVLQVALTYD